MNFITKKKVIIAGIIMFVLLSFLVCSHSIPMNHDGGQHSISSCSVAAFHLPTTLKAILGIVGFLLILSLGFISDLFGQSDCFKINKNVFSYLPPPPLVYSRGNSLFEALRKGIIHSQIYSFVVV